MRAVSELRDVLEQIAAQAPPPRERFDEELWERVRERERSNRARWRVATVVIATVAVAAAGAAGVFALRGTPAGTTTDRTISCRLTTTLASAGLDIGATVTEPGPYGAASVWVGNGQATFAGAGKGIVPRPGTTTSGAYFDESDCTSSHANVPLSRLGLRSLGVFSNSSRSADMRESCFMASNSSISIRMRVVLSRPGVASFAQLAIRGGKRPHPIAFVSWTPTRFRAYVAPGCEQS